MSSPLRVLIVEDLEDDAQLLLLELRQAGREVIHERVDTAAGMTAALKARPWDIIISDYSMPQFSGLAAVAVARERASDLPFILVSGTVGEEVAVQAMKAGANDYLFKGNLKRLAPAVERELRDAEGRREARRVERELRKRENQLADAQRLARLGSWHHDFSENVSLWSEEVYRTLGNESDSSPPTLDEFLARVHVDDRAHFTDPLNDPSVNQFEKDFRVVRPDETVRFVHVRGDISRDSDGKPLEAAGMIQDITERKLAEQELRAAHDELAIAKDAAESANHAKDKFLAVLSHELRTPLTPVLAVVSQLEVQPELPEAVRSELSTIRRNVEMEARLIDDLLDVTRIMRNKIEFHYEVVDAHGTVRRALEMFQRDVNTKGLNITVALDAKRHHAWADPARLHQVFMNLLANAVKFTPKGGSISVRSNNDEQGRLRVEIRDTGIGIDPDVLPRLFNSFEQGERTVTRRYGGLGLGLSIAKSLIEMHGGTIAASSAGRDQGATLSVELPTIAAADAELSAVPSRPAPADSISGERTFRVLLVEDHADTRRVMARLLKSFGCSVITAGSVREALDFAKNEKFDLLVSDIGLPDGSGTEVMREMKSRYQTKGIAISGFGQDEDLRRSLDAGFEMHLTKPVDFTTLQDVITKIAG